MNLIDKDALVAEIERLARLLPKEEGLSMNLDWARNTLSCLYGFLNTLEVKEVDLEKEVDNIMPRFLYHITCREEEIKFAKYFFELGLNVKQVQDGVKIGETQILLEDDGGEPPYDGKQWLDLSCTEYEIQSDKFKDGDNVEIIIRKAQKGE